MLLNISYNDPSQKNRIDKAVGKTFSLQKRWNLGGIGSEKLTISNASIDIHNLLILDQNINSCNIELRPKGIIIRFRSLLETYALIVPYFKLNLYKGNSQEYSIYLDQYYIKILSDSSGIREFFKKIKRQQLLNTPPHLEDL